MKPTDRSSPARLAAGAAFLALGFALPQLAFAACPPGAEDQASPAAVTPAAQHMALLRSLSGSDGNLAAHLDALRALHRGGGQPLVMHFSSLAELEALDALTDVAGDPPQEITVIGQPLADGDSVSGSMMVMEQNGVRITIKDGKIDGITVDGNTVPNSRARRNGDKWIVVDKSGAQIADFMAPGVARAKNGEANAFTIMKTEPGAGGASSNRTVIASDGKKLTIVDGKVTEATVDGKKVPADRVKKQGSSWIIQDENGKTIGEVQGLTGELAPGGSRRFSTTLRGARAPVAIIDKDNWTPPKVMVGISMADPSDELRGHLGLKDDSGIMISAVHPGTPAADAGLAPFDIITRIDGQAATQETVRNVLKDKNPGDEVEVEVLQHGVSKKLKVKLVAFDAAKFPEHTVEDNSDMFDAPAPPAPPAPPEAPVAPGTKSRTAQRDAMQAKRDAMENALRQSEDARRDAQRSMERLGAIGILRGMNEGELPYVELTGPRDRALTERMTRLEQKLDRLNELLEKLLEERAAKGQPSGGGEKSKPATSRDW